MSKHTPGPWKVYEENADEIIIIGPREYSGASPVIAKVVKHLSSPEGTDQANTQLVLVAPQLEEAGKAAFRSLAAFLDYADISTIEKCYDPIGALEDLRAALALIESSGNDPARS